jgi:hypothetical protein
LNFSTGQILCFLMILMGLAWALIASRLKDRNPVRVYNTEGEGCPKSAAAGTTGEKTAERNKRRKLRNKLR